MILLHLEFFNAFNFSFNENCEMCLNIAVMQNKQTNKQKT